MTTIAVVGSLNLDISLQVRSFPQPGETMLAVDSARAFGGKGGNQAVAASVLGGQVAFIGAVGNDEEGRAYREHLTRYGVESTGISTAEETSTGTAFILVDEAGENVIVVDSAANSALDPPRVNDQVQRLQPSLLLAQLEVPVPVLEAALRGLDPNAVFILNPAPMPADVTSLATVLARCDVLVPNRQELGQLAGMPEPRTPREVQNCLDSLHFEGTVVVTLGSDGAVLFSPSDGLHAFPPVDVRPVDTSGAGDAFCGALAFGIAEGLTIADAVRQANDVAAMSTQARGAQLTSAPKGTGHLAGPS